MRVATHDAHVMDLIEHLLRHHHVTCNSLFMSNLHSYRLHESIVDAVHAQLQRCPHLLPQGAVLARSRLRACPLAATRAHLQVQLPPSAPSPRPYAVENHLRRNVMTCWHGQGPVSAASRGGMNARTCPFLLRTALLKWVISGVGRSGTAATCTQSVRAPTSDRARGT